MGRESSPAEAGLPSLEDPASAIWAIGRATNAIPAPMSPIGLTDPGADAGPDPDDLMEMDEDELAAERLEKFQKYF